VVTNKRALAMAIVVAGELMAMASPGLAGQQTLQVQLRNYAGLQAPVIQAAENQIAAIFDAAGINVIWIPQTAPALEEGVVVVNILSAPPAQQGHLPPGAMGFTSVTRTIGRFTNVIASRVDEMAQMHDVSMGVLLGAAIAHELGHLLMPHAPHSAWGVMRASWSEADCQLAARGNLTFLPAEANMLRGSVDHLHAH
jgi:hypothetical protein